MKIDPKVLLSTLIMFISYFRIKSKIKYKEKFI